MIYSPSQFLKLASHEIAQTRLPHIYDELFNTPDLHPHLQWCLVGGKGSVSPFHVDGEGLGTALVVLEGQKYWIMATRIREDERVTSIDSLRPAWNPYYLNEGDNANCFCFEAIHLQKGDMLWVWFLISEYMADAF